MIVVVGAGLAGLACALRLRKAGRAVMVLEASGSSGGRLRTRRTSDGFQLDQGFQVLFAGYPALLRTISLSAIYPRYFESGVDVALDGRFRTLAHPLFAPVQALRTPVAGLVSPRDVLAFSRLILGALPLGDGPLPPSEITAMQRLVELGFSDRCIHHVLIPLFGGISLDRGLASDATFLGFVLRYLSLGRVFVPARGIQALSNHLTSMLPANAIRYDAAVDRLLLDGSRVRGVGVGSEEVEAEAVVLAVDGPAAQSLAGIPVPPGRRSCTTMYVRSERPLLESRRLVLNGDRSLVNHMVQLSNVAPEYAPIGQHLLAAVSVGEMEGSDDAVAQAMLDDILAWCPGADRLRLEPIDVVRVSYSQFAQPPGVYARLPTVASGPKGLVPAGEYLHSSSTQGALRGGEMAAQAVLRGLV